MKKNKYFIKIALLSSFSLLYVNPQAKSQDIIYEDPDMHAEFSIIRHYKNDVDITYNLAERHSFIYTDRATNTVRYFDIPLEQITKKIDQYIYDYSFSIGSETPKINSEGLIIYCY